MDSIVIWFWKEGIFLFLYILVTISILYGLKQILQVPMKERINQWHYRFRLRKVRQSHTTVRHYDNPLMKHLNLLIKATNNDKENDVFSFLIISTLLFIVTFIFMFIPLKDMVLSIILGVLVSIIPYMALQLRLRKLRYLMGEDFLSIVQNLQQNYNANHYDMYHALVETQKTIKHKALRRVLLKLISDLQVSRNEDELRQSVHYFVYTAGSSWAKRLGNIIMKGYLHNENVLKTLLILSSQMEETEEMLEEEKSHAMDSVVNGYLTAPIFILSLLLGYFVSGPQDWFNLQFKNQWTVTLLMVCVIGVIFSIFISMILKRPKNDL